MIVRQSADGLVHFVMERYELDDEVAYGPAHNRTYVGSTVAWWYLCWSSYGQSPAGFTMGLETLESVNCMHCLAETPRR